jgi:ATP-binding cassette subfamily B protein
MRKNAYIDRLRAVPIFTGCTARELQLVARLVEELTIPDGTVLVREGEVGHEFFILVEGSAEVSKGGRMVATLVPGDHFGELALLDHHPRDATITMTSPGVVLVMAPREFNSLLLQAPSLTRRIAVALARRVHELEAPQRAVGHA